MSPHAPAERMLGFTLVELVVVLVIVGALAAVSAPMFFSADVFRERGFYDETVSAVRYAQKLAVATGCTVRVNVTATGFTLFRAANLAACNAGTYTTDITDPSSSATTFTRTAPGGVVLTPATFDFAADGSASANVTVNVGTRPFNVIAATGFVQVP